MNGTIVGDGFGYSVAGVEDLNGDGVHDFLVGAPNADPLGINNAGEVKAYSGANGATLLSIEGTSTGDSVGSSVASVGDLNGDAVPDFLVGAFQADPLGLVNAGKAMAISGATGAVLLTVSGTNTGDYFGYSVAGVGDLNGDTFPDFVVGAPGADPFGAVGAGEATAISGATGASLLNAIGTSPDDQFGRSVAGVGDLNGDGVPDLLVGAPYADPFGITYAGRATAISGATGAVLLSLIGSSPIDLFGYSVAGVGDLNGDAVPDIFVGAPGYLGPGRATAISGGNGAALFTVTGVSGADSFGEAVGSVGDLNADGVPDLVVGAPKADPFGIADAGQATAISGANGAVLLTLSGMNTGDVFGLALAGVGDLNGDTVPDLLLGSVNANQAKVFSLTNPPMGGGGSVTSFGGGCPGSGGGIPLIATGGGFPCVGNSAFEITASNVLGGTIAVLITGLSSSSWGGVPLPLNLSPAGMPGCSLLVSPDILAGTGTTGAGNATTVLPIPLLSSIVGASIYFQWYIVDPGPSIIPGVMSDGLHVQIG